MLVVTLRLHRSWTHWLQNRRVANLVRQERRLRAMEELTAHQLERVRKAERKVHPLQIPLPEPDPVPEPSPEMHRVWQMPEPEPSPPPRQEPPPEELEPMPDPAQEIAQQIGLPLQRT